MIGAHIKTVMQVICFIGNIWFIFSLFANLSYCQDRIIFSDENNSYSSLLGDAELQSNKIPEQLLIRMKDVHNFKELLNRFVSRDEYVTSVESIAINEMGVNGRKGLAAAAAAALIAEPAKCQPEMRVVELEKSENLGILLWPSCVRVLRCGGCCTSKMLSCSPVTTSILNITVVQLYYNPEKPDAFENQGTRIMSLVQHDRCACLCKERPEDCMPVIHRYRPEECRCVCNNQEEAALCTGAKRIWDTRECLCKCRHVLMCSTGRYFDALTCRCEVLRSSLAAKNVDGSRSVISRISRKPAVTEV